MSKRLDRSELEARRIEAGKLLQRGVRPAEVARRLRVSRTSVGRWQQMLTSGGRRGLHGAPRTGRPPLLDANDQKRLIAALKAGALAQGYSSDLWTLGRVGKLIETLTGQRYSESGVWRLLKRLGVPTGGRRNAPCSGTRRLFGNGRPSAGRRLKNVWRAPSASMNSQGVLVCINISGHRA